MSRDNGISNVYNSSDADVVKSVGKFANSLLINSRITFVTLETFLV